MNHLAPIIAARVPALIAAVGEKTSYRFFEFFTANIAIAAYFDKIINLSLFHRGQHFPA